MTNDNKLYHMYYFSNICINPTPGGWRIHSDLDVRRSQIAIILMYILYLQKGWRQHELFARC